MPEAILRCRGRHKGFCLHWMANDSLVELEKKKKKWIKSNLIMGVRMGLVSLAMARSQQGEDISRGPE